MSFFDDLGNFGSGLLDTVGEGLDNVVQGATKTPERSANAATTQQPKTPVKDNHGNAVTGNPLPQQPQDKTLLYVGGGVGAAVLLLVIVLAVKD